MACTANTEKTCDASARTESTIVIQIHLGDIPIRVRNKIKASYTDEHSRKLDEPKSNNKKKAELMGSSGEVNVEEE